MVVQLYKWSGNNFSSREFYMDNGLVIKFWKYGIHLNFSSKYFSLAFFSNTKMYDLSVTLGNLLDQSFDDFLVFRLEIEKILKEIRVKKREIK